MKTQYQNASFLYMDDVQGLTNPGLIYKAADTFQFWSGTGTTKIVFTNDNTNLSVEVANNELNASVANISTLTATTITGDISPNLTAGTGITLSTTSGVTTINSAGLSTSTQYYFKANGTANQSLTTGATNEVLNFNNVLFQSPSGYSITNKEYVVQVAGVYQFFYQIFFAFNNANAEVRLGLYLTRGGTTTTINQTGQYIYTAERLGLTYECLVGDKFSVRVVYNNSGGTISTVLGQSWFEGYLLQPENNTITSSTALTTNSLTTSTANISTVNTSTTNSQLVNASVVNGDFLNGNIANNLLGGTNITLSTSSGVTTIDGPIRSVFGVTRVGVFTPGSVTDVRIPYNSTKITNSNYSWSGLVLTISAAGTYLISATCGLVSASYNNRVTGRIRTLTNGTWDGNNDAESFCYLRHDDYGEFESMTISNFPRVFAAGDTLQIQCQVGKASAGGPGNSNFAGLVMTPGANLTVEKVA